MKKVLIFGAVLFSATAFSQRVEKGDVQLNAGIAFDRYVGSVGFYGGADYGFHPDITLGLEARFGTNDYGYGAYDYRGNWFGIGVNGNYHFNRLLDIPNKYDVYAGVTVGFNSFSYDNDNWPGWADPHDSGAGVSAQVGARYYFTDHFGLNAEANAGSLFNGGKIGISYKF